MRSCYEKIKNAYVLFYDRVKPIPNKFTIFNDNNK